MDEKWQEIKETGYLGHQAVILLDSTESTNLYAEDLGRNGAEHGTVVAAETQSKGRGRLGREWQSPSGTGLYFSLIWHSRLNPKDLAKITLAAGVGLSLAIENKTELEPKIKWPNDLLINSKKVGGILTENCGQQHKHSLIIVGLGININTLQSSFHEDLSGKASSLYICSGKKYDRGEIFAEILKELCKTLNDLERGRFGKILKKWRKRDATVNKKMTWLTPDRKVVTGISLGVDDNGLLNIRDSYGKVHQVLSGDLDLFQVKSKGYLE